MPPERGRGGPRRRCARVPGRLERVEAGQPYAILVDYAHTEDALERLLAAVRELTDKKIILVFGCGGDRDRGKREPMGRIAGHARRHPDRDLRQSALRGSGGDPLGGRAGPRRLGRDEVSADRRPPRRRSGPRSIWPTRAPSSSSPGKGHETTQVIGDRRSRSTTAPSPRSSRRADELHAVGGRAGRSASPPPAEAPLSGAAVDSRAVRPGDLFVALPGARVDGHDFASRRSSRGAAAVLAERALPAPGRAGFPSSSCPNAREALLALAAWLKRRAGFRLAAIAGSVGKTTTKEFAAAILSRHCRASGRRPETRTARSGSRSRS